MNERMTYWKDFIFAIFDLIRIIFIILIIVGCVVLYITFTPWWVSVVILLIGWICWFAHDQATEKAQARIMIDNNISRYEANIEQSENNIRRYYDKIAKAHLDEDTSNYVSLIEYEEKDIERYKDEIRDLKIRRTLI